jgi:phosphoribosylformylglycinamidine cyclo-ligase
VPSSGFHSNGYSLLRKIFSADLEKWADTLMTPTALYAGLVKDLRKKIKGLRVCANITGGGLENIPRVLPKGHFAELRPWRLPEPFLEVKRRGQKSWQSLTVTLNCGIGFVVVVDKKEVQKTLRVLRANGYAKAWEFGRVVKGKSVSGYELDYEELANINGV